MNTINKIKITKKQLTDQISKMNYSIDRQYYNSDIRLIIANRITNFNYPHINNYNENLEALQSTNTYKKIYDYYNTLHKKKYYKLFYNPYWIHQNTLTQSNLRVVILQIRK